SGVERPAPAPVHPRLRSGSAAAYSRTAGYRLCDDQGQERLRAGPVSESGGRGAYRRQCETVQPGWRGYAHRGNLADSKRGTCMTEITNQEEQPLLLLVDDDPTFTRVMARALMRRGLDVDTGGDAGEGMQPGGQRKACAA